MNEEVSIILLNWLKELDYPLQSSSQSSDASVEELLQGEFGESLLWLTKILVGRRATAHVKRELHELRETAPAKLSSVTKEKLGLNLIDLATRENSRLQKQDSIISQSIIDILKELETESNKVQVGKDCLSARILLNRLDDLKVDYEEQRMRIEKVNELIESWKVSFESDSKNMDIKSALNQILLNLQLPSQSTSEPLSIPLSSSTVLDEILTYQLELSQQLTELTARHIRIKPPSIEIFNNTLNLLRKKIAESMKKEVVKASPATSDKRQELIESIIRTRGRRTLLENAINTSTLTLSDSTEELSEVENKYEALKKSTQDSLQFRSNIIYRIKLLGNELASQSSIEDSQTQLSETKSKIISEIDLSLSILLSNYESESAHKIDVPVNGGNDNLAIEVTRALNTLHLLNTQVPLSAPHSEFEIANACDSIAESRFVIEALRPSLEANLNVELSSKRLEDSAEMRQQFIEGRFLPSTRLKDGKLLNEKFKILEKQSSRKQML